MVSKFNFIEEFYLHYKWLPTNQGRKIILPLPHHKQHARGQVMDQDLQHSKLPCYQTVTYAPNNESKSLAHQPTCVDGSALEENWEVHSLLQTHQKEHAGKTYIYSLKVHHKKLEHKQYGKKLLMFLVHYRTHQRKDVIWWEKIHKTYKCKI